MSTEKRENVKTNPRSQQKDTVYGIQHTVYGIQYTVYSIQHIAYSVHDMIGRRSIAMRD